MKRDAVLSTYNRTKYPDQIHVINYVGKTCSQKFHLRM